MWARRVSTISPGMVVGSFGFVIFMGHKVMKLAGMSRIDLIARIAGRKPTTPAPKPQRGSRPTGRPFQLRMIEGLKPKALNVHSEWLREPEESAGKDWKPGFRHGPHPLTRIAERWRAPVKRE